jgi:hypothetical protein
VWQTWDWIGGDGRGGAHQWGKPSCEGGVVDGGPLSLAAFQVLWRVGGMLGVSVQQTLGTTAHTCASGNCLSVCQPASLLVCQSVSPSGANCTRQLARLSWVGRTVLWTQLWAGCWAVWSGPPLAGSSKMECSNADKED